MTVVTRHRLPRRSKPHADTVRGWPDPFWRFCS